MEQSSPRARTTPKAAQQPFRFLDLPEDIRLMVYDLLPTMLRYRSIKLQNNENMVVNVITQNSVRWMLISSCRTIHAEATPLLYKESRTETLRIVMNWTALGDPVVQNLLHCVDPTQDCHQKDWHTILGSKDAPRNIYDVGRCDFSSHRDLHDLVSRASNTKVPRRVEVAILYDEDIGQQPSRYRDPLGQLYDFVYDMGNRPTAQQLETILRPAPGTTGTPSVPMQLGFDMWQHPEWIAQQEKFGVWSCALGPSVQSKEWNTRWEPSPPDWWGYLSSDDYSDADSSDTGF